VAAPKPGPAPAEPTMRRVRTVLTGGAKSRRPVAAADSGEIFIHCEPWANISIDGRGYGRTPLSRNIVLSRGKHLIRLYNDFCEPLEQEVEIISNTVVRRRYKLQVKPAYR
jgi:hypothetical protein